jgi:hypothetical protein
MSRKEDGMKDTVRPAVLFAAVLAALVCPALETAQAQLLPVSVYGGPMDERAYALVEGIDPGYCLAGWTNSFGFGAPLFKNVLVVKTDPAGFPIWADVSRGSDDEEAWSMTRTLDGGYALTGYTCSYGPGIPNPNIFIIKLNMMGAVQWGWVYGGMQDDRAFSITATVDSGFAVCGYTHSFGPAPWPNIIVLKVDKFGLPQWARTYWASPVHATDEGYSIVELAAGGYAVCGRFNVTVPGLFCPFVMRLDPLGNLIWVNYVPAGDGGNEAYSVAEDRMGNILTAGWTQSYGSGPGLTKDIFVLKHAGHGVPIWQFTYGWPEGDEQVLDDRSLVATTDSGCALCGLTTSVGPGIPNPNFLVMKLDPNGLVQWCRSHPSPVDPGLLSDEGMPMIQETYGGFAMAGWTSSFTTVVAGENFHLATLDPLGNRPVCFEPQEPVVETLPYDGCAMGDSEVMLSEDTMPLEEVMVDHQPICILESIRGEQDPTMRGLTLWALSDRVELAMNRPGYVRLDLYDAAGRSAAPIAHEFLGAGRHTLTIPAALPRGVYLLRGFVAGSPAFAKVTRL